MSSPPLEKHFQNKVIKKLKTLKSTWFVKVADRAKSGLPDVLLCVDGQFVAMELKRSIKHKPTPLQKYILSQVGDAAGLALVAYPENWDEVFKRLEMLAGGTIILANQGDNK